MDSNAPLVSQILNATILNVELVYKYFKQRKQPPNLPLGPSCFSQKCRKWKFYCRENNSLFRGAIIHSSLEEVLFTLKDIGAASQAATYCYRAKVVNRNKTSNHNFQIFGVQKHWPKAFLRFTPSILSWKHKTMEIPENIYLMDREPYVTLCILSIRT